MLECTKLNKNKLLYMFFVGFSCLFEERKTNSFIEEELGERKRKDEGAGGG